VVSRSRRLSWPGTARLIRGDAAASGRSKHLRPRPLSPLAARLALADGLADVLGDAHRAHVSEHCHHGLMAYDTELAARVRASLAAESGLAEKRMFGGLAFLIDGSMTIAVSGHGGLMARVDPDESDALTERDGVAPMVMNRRPMRGWLRVAPDVVEDDASLHEWVTRCVGYVKGTINAPGDGAV